MRTGMRCALLLALVVSSVSAARGRPARKPAPAAPPPPAQAAAADSPPQRGPTRLEFTDPRLITGQLNSGAVYLFDRKELKSRSMVRLREDFREELVGP